MIAIILAMLAVVNVSNNSVTYACNGVTATYQVNFPYLASTDLVVTSTTVGGSVTTLTPGTDWSVNFASTSSTATLTLANPAVKCPNTNVLKITRSRAYTQPYGFRAQSVYNQALHETAYDNLEMQIQQLFGLQAIVAVPVANNAVFAGPVSGGPLPASFRLLDVSDIPSLPTSQIFGTFGDGVLVSSYSGVGACGASSWVTGLTRNSTPTCAQPAFSNLSGVASVIQIPNLDASKVTTGTFSSSQIPNLDVSKVTTGTLAQARGGTGSGAVTCSAGTFLTSNGTSYSCGAAVGFLASLNTWAASQLFSGGLTFNTGSISSAGVGALASLNLTTPLPIGSGGTGSATVANNLVFAGPTSGGPLAPSFRALAAGDIPSLPASQTTSGTFADAFLASGYSGTGACGANTWASALSRNASPTCTQPAFTSISGTATAAQVPSLDATKITTGTLTRPVSLNSGETTFNTDSLTFNTGGCGLQWNTPHAGLNLFCTSATAIHIDSGTGGGLSNIIFDDFSGSNGLLAVASGALAVSSAPQSAESSFTGYVPSGVAATTAFARRIYSLASTLTVSSNYTGVVAGSGAGNYVLKLCSDGSVCSGPNTYLTCTITCANAAGTTTACSVTKSAISLSTTLTWNVTTACATTNPAGNATAYATTP